MKTIRFIPVLRQYTKIGYGNGSDIGPLVRHGDGVSLKIGSFHDVNAPKGSGWGYGNGYGGGWGHAPRKVSVLVNEEP